jgi:DNA-binding response OmpR family regulator
MNAPANKPVAYRRRLVLAYADSAHAVLCCRQLRRLGWEVHLTASGTEARRLAQTLEPAVVVLDAALRDESGWLTCAKLLHDRPGQRVVLVTDEVTSEGERLAGHVGAAILVRRSAGAAALVDQVQGGVLSTAG